MANDDPKKPDTTSTPQPEPPRYGEVIKNDGKNKKDKIPGETKEKKKIRLVNYGLPDYSQLSRLIYPILSPYRTTIGKKLLCQSIVKLSSIAVPIKTWYSPNGRLQSLM